MLADDQLAEAERKLRRDISTAERKLADIQEEIRRKRRELSAVRVLRGTDVPAKQPQRVTSQKIQDAAYDILHSKGAAMHFRDLYAALEKSGMTLGGKDPASGLITYLTRDRDRFEWVSRGTYRAKTTGPAGT